MQLRLIFISIQIVILQLKELAHFLDLRILGFQPEIVPKLHGIIKCINIMQEFLVCVSKPLILILQRHVMIQNVIVFSSFVKHFSTP